MTDSGFPDAEDDVRSEWIGLISELPVDDTQVTVTREHLNITVLMDSVTWHHHTHLDAARIQDDEYLPSILRAALADLRDRLGI